MTVKATLVLDIKSGDAAILKVLAKEKYLLISDIKAIVGDTILLEIEARNIFDSNEGE